MLPADREHLFLRANDDAAQTKKFEECGSFRANDDTAQTF